VLGSILDAGWALGLALVAAWAAISSRRAPSRPQPPANPASNSKDLAVSAAATVAGVVVLAFGTVTHISAVATVLAGVTLLAAAARTQVAFQQLVRMTDLRRQAATDDLTGLPNRRALYMQAAANLADPKRPRQALLMLDLNRFKEVNDSLGHHAGDQLLIQVGTRLSKPLRPGDLLVRLGGDEFAFLLADAGPAEASAVATRLCTALTEPFTLNLLPVHSSASIGIALFPEHGSDVSTLLRKADIAMYKAKALNVGQHLYGAGDGASAVDGRRAAHRPHRRSARRALPTQDRPAHRGCLRRRGAGALGSSHSRPALPRRLPRPRRRVRADARPDPDRS
jgi:diguanylate cyclase